MLKTFFLLSCLLLTFSPLQAADLASQQAVATTWTDEERSAILETVNEQLKLSDKLVAYNDDWGRGLLIMAAVASAIVAIATATANSENQKFQPFKPWFLWGSSVLSIVAALLASLPKMTNLEAEEEFYRLKSSRLNGLRSQIQLNLVTKQAAHDSLKEIFSLTPTK